jgi:NADPH-dependent F420 reductase
MIAARETLTLAILGGTGKEGKGLALRWAKAGYQVLIGSRSYEKATATAQQILKLLDGNASIGGTTNRDAAKAADIAILTVPYMAHRAILEDIKDVMQGKILVDVTVPISSARGLDLNISSSGSAAQEASAILGENVQVTSAFQNISYKLLLQEESIPCDVLVTGTSKDARVETLQLVSAAGFTGWDAGPIENAFVTEGLTRVLIYINKEYGIKNAGIKITGVTNDPEAHL